MDTDNTDKEKRKINALYILLIISTILGFMPYVSALIVSLVLLTGVLLSAYAFRKKDDPDSLLNNHMTYLIGTIWIGSTFLLAGITAAGYWVFVQGDHSVIHNASAQLQNGIMPSESEIAVLGMNYIEANKMLLITATLVFVGPAILYFVYRIANGYSRALKGYRMAKPKGWF